jgi:cyclase
MRIISRIDIKNNYVIKGINLEGLRKIGNPKEIIRKYYKQKIDEFIIIDSVASLYGRNNLFELIRNITKEIFVPITLGGGIRTLNDIENALKCGADKVAINSQLFEDTSFLLNATKNFGESTVVVNVEAKRIKEDYWEPYKFCGREKTNMNLTDWIIKVQEIGCGEILLTSVDHEGTQIGFDYDLINFVYDKIKKPLIISGGCGKLSDIDQLFKMFSDTSVALASVLHYNKIAIDEIKKIIK